MKLSFFFLIIISVTFCLQTKYLDTNIVFDYSPNNATFICNGSSNSNQIISQRYSISFNRTSENNGFKESLQFVSPSSSLGRMKHLAQTTLRIKVSFTSYQISNLLSNTLLCRLVKDTIICTSNILVESFLVEYDIVVSCNNYCVNNNNNNNNDSITKFEIPITLKQSDGLKLKVVQVEQLSCQYIPPVPPQPAICSNCIYETDHKTHLYNKTIGQKISLESLVNTVHTHLSTCNITYFTATQQLVVGIITLQWQYHWKVTFSIFANDIGNILFTLPFNGNYSIRCCTSSLIDIGGLMVFQEYGSFIQLNAKCPATSPVLLQQSDVAFYFANTTVENIEYQCSTSNSPDECIEFMLKYTTPQDNAPYLLNTKSITNVASQVNRISSIVVSNFFDTYCSNNNIWCLCAYHPFLSTCSSNYSKCFNFCNGSIAQFGPTDYIVTAISGLNWINSTNNPFVDMNTANCKDGICSLVSPSPLIATYFTSVSTNATYTDLNILYQIFAYNTTTQETPIVCSGCLSPLGGGHFNITNQINIYSDYQVSSISSVGNFDCNNAFYTMQSIVVTQRIDFFQVPYYIYDIFLGSSTFFNICPNGNSDYKQDYTCTIFHNGNKLFRYATEQAFECAGNKTSELDETDYCDEVNIIKCLLDTPIQVGETITYTCCTGKNYDTYPNINYLMIGKNENLTDAVMIVPDYLSPPSVCSSGTNGQPCPVATDNIVSNNQGNLAFSIVDNVLKTDNVIWCGISVYNGSSAPSASNTIARFTISKENAYRNLQCIGNNEYDNGCNSPNNIDFDDYLYLQCVSSGSINPPLFADGTTCVSLWIYIYIYEPIYMNACFPGH